MNRFGRAEGYASPDCHLDDSL